MIRRCDKSKKEVIKNNIYIYLCSTSSTVIFRHSPDKNSVMNGSDGLHSLKNPNTQRRSENFNQSSICLLDVCLHHGTVEK